MAKRKLSKLQQEYNKEYARIQRAMRRAESRGFLFDVEPVLPPKTKKPTRKELNKLKAITPEKLYEKARAYNPETGEIYSGKEARAIERRASAQKAAETRRRKTEIQAVKQEPLPVMADIIIGRFREMISRFPGSAEPVLTPWLDNLINVRGKEAVATMLEDGRAAGLIIDNKVAYSQMIYTYMADMLSYLPLDSAERQEVTDSMEEWEDNSEWPE